MVVQASGVGGSEDKMGAAGVAGSDGVAIVVATVATATVATVVVAAVAASAIAASAVVAAADEDDDDDEDKGVDDVGNGATAGGGEDGEGAATLAVVGAADGGDDSRTWGSAAAAGADAACAACAAACWRLSAGGTYAPTLRGTLGGIGAGVEASAAAGTGAGAGGTATVTSHGAGRWAREHRRTTTADTLSLLPRLSARCTSLLAASCSVAPPASQWRTMDTASWAVTTSHTPSLPRMRNSVPWVMARW